MSWAEVPITGGVVTTRDESALERGELISASNCRLKKNDLKQIHNDLEATLLANETVLDGPFYLSFEGAGDRIMFITSTDIKTGAVGSGIFTSIQSFTGTATRAWAVHRGDEWFVGSDAGNYVIKDNVARPMETVRTTIDSINISAVNSSVGNSSQYDVFSWFVTAYDSVNDVETEALAVLSKSVSTDGDGYDFSWPVNPVTIASNFDKWRLYRHYWGNDGASSSGLLFTAFDSESGYIRLGGLIAEKDISDKTYTDNISFISDPPIPYPIVYTDPIAGGSLFRYLKAPAPFTLGTLFQDSLVVNDPATSKQILRYSPPGQPEYQPDPYFMYFANEASDEIVGLHTVSDKLIVLTTGGAHRVNWLPLGGRVSQGQGRAQEVLTERVGCVGRKASTKIETERGEFVVWLSRRGLEWSNGQSWGDACPDFGADALTASLGGSVLVADTANYRIRLYNGNKVWDFYYHPSHLKNGRMKLMGPSTYPIVVSGAVSGPASDIDGVWTASSSAIYREGPGFNSSDTVIETGQLGGGPFDDIKIRGHGLTHTGNGSTKYYAKTFTKLRGYDEVESSQDEIAGGEFNETGRVAVSQMGAYFRQRFTISGATDWAAGQAWVDAEATGGDGVG